MVDAYTLLPAMLLVEEFHLPCYRLYHRLIIVIGTRSASIPDIVVTCNAIGRRMSLPCYRLYHRLIIVISTHSDSIPDIVVTCHAIG